MCVCVSVWKDWLINDLNIFNLYNYPAYIVHTSVICFECNIDKRSKNFEIFLISKVYGSIKNVLTFPKTFKGISVLVYLVYKIYQNHIL